MAKFHLPLLNSLRAFEAAARHQSIQKACDELHVTHSAVSRQIQKLELQVGRHLFERTHRKIALTDEGLLLFRAVTLGFSHIQRAFVQLSGSEISDRLVISVDSDFAGLWLVPRLADFYAIVANVLVEILAENTPPRLHDPRANCAILYAEAGRDLEDGEVLFRSRLFPVCAKELGGQRPPRSAEDLRHYVLLHDRTIFEWEEYLRGCAPAIDVNFKSGFVFSETSHCLDAAARGQGVAIGDDFLAAIHLQEGRLIKPFGSAVPSKNAYYFVVPGNAPKHPSVKTFRMWLLQSIDQHRKNFLIT
jgi:LysR family transcriptional regulator, glycine cleavage system transcriptional activator